MPLVPAERPLALAERPLVLAEGGGPDSFRKPAWPDVLTGARAAPPPLRAARARRAHLP